uniref:WH2 domain-containing protein n=1 Tax=Mola mola TaxID=94237 RepID=A0A3Q3XFK2_MOLML
MKNLQKRRELVHLDDNVPAGMRQPDQTSKTPTGGFNRAALLKYWEDEYDGEKKVSEKGKKAQNVFNKHDTKEDEVEAKDECKKAQIRKKCHQKNSPTKSSRRTENTDRNLDPTPNRPSGNPTVIDKTLDRKIAEMVKQHEGSNNTKSQSNQRKAKSKKLKNGANDSADILKDLKNALKPSQPKRRDEPSNLPLPQRSSRDDLMAAIRGSSIGSLKRVSCWKLLEEPSHVWLS